MPSRNSTRQDYGLSDLTSAQSGRAKERARRSVVRSWLEDFRGWSGGHRADSVELKRLVDDAVRGIQSHVRRGLALADEGDFEGAAFELLHCVNLQAIVQLADISPEVGRARTFARGRRRGARSPLATWLDQYLAQHPTATNQDLKLALRLVPEAELIPPQTTDDTGIRLEGQVITTRNLVDRAREARKRLGIS